MAAALMELRALDPPPDHVLLEASGVALPGAIAGSVGLLQGYSVDGVVILADGAELRRNANHKYMGDTVTRQLADADIVVLNKADLVDAATLAQTQDFALSHAKNAQVVTAEHGRLPPAVVLQSFVERERDAGSRHDVSGFASVAVAMEAACDPEAVAQVLASEALGLIRAKGFVRDEQGGVFAVQCVARRWAVEPADFDGALGVVCIGLKPEFDAERIKSAVLTPE